MPEFNGSETQLLPACSVQFRRFTRSRFHGATLVAALSKPEIMSPAGHWPQLRAAIEAGADAVYFGLKHFTARAKVGFTLEELPEVMRTLHCRGVRGYVTFNTLVFEHELDEAARTMRGHRRSRRRCADHSGPRNSAIARQIAPSVELHASTQMSITDAEGVRFAQSFGRGSRNTGT